MPVIAPSAAEQLWRPGKVVVGLLLYEDVAEVPAPDRGGAGGETAAGHMNHHAAPSRPKLLDTECIYVGYSTSA
ncbi:hypothetical protein GCM10010140_74260 [Streptosporangium pseudovulgare]|uniref:Uncharacterized protein n=1 Tax=Streptosporangium pseudovulgare TaxID=35765 RepID=A0ABQ2RIX3_9ACTN|nr:hypothetical protein GCM10010140_74260 [Streptosporangium pseudovulgare]